MTKIEHATSVYISNLKAGYTQKSAIENASSFASRAAPKKWTKETAAAEIIRLAKSLGFEAAH